MYLCIQFLQSKFIKRFKQNQQTQPFSVPAGNGRGGSKLKKMTLQQIEYALALATYRQFSKAAEVCGVTQPSLSAQVAKLEEELGVLIFDRKKKDTRPTPAGELLLKQAEELMKAKERLVESSHQIVNRARGDVYIGMVQSIAPFLMPQMVHYMRTKCPEVMIHCIEGEINLLVEMMGRGELDMAIMSAMNQIPHMLSIPLYRENIIAYLPPSHPLLEKSEIKAKQLKSTHVWGYRDMLEAVMGTSYKPQTEFMSGSLFTLVAMAEATGGVLLAPQTIIDILIADRYDHLRPIVNPAPSREVHLYIREDYVMEKMLNVVGEAVCNIVPEPMLDPHLQKFGIRL